jgi:membrane fusion protein, heavy metal efflux system
MKTTLKYIIIHCLLMTSLLACRSNETEQPVEEHHDEHQEENVVEMTADQMKTGGVVLGAVEQRQISGTIKVNGVLDVPPQQLVSVSAPLGGFLKNTELLEGSRVRKGQSIATIENLDFIQIQQDYLEAKNQFELAKLEYDRQQELAKENVNSQKTLQQSKSNFLIWQAKYHSYREKLKVLDVDVVSVDEGKITSVVNLYSPIDGYVTEVNVNIGKFVNPTDVLFEIVDTEHLHAELIVFERDVPKLRIGQKVRFMLANESNERMATIYLIGREIGKDRTVQIHCHIDKEDKELLPGMYLSAMVETGNAMVPALPDEAIISYQGKEYIFIEADGEHKTGDASDNKHFMMLEINTSNREMGYTEVSLPENTSQAQVVVKGAYSLLSKMKNSEEEGGHAH